MICLRFIVNQILRLATLLWASPCTVVGIVFAGISLLAGGKARWSLGALEVTYRDRAASCSRWARWLPFSGIVFGHVIWALTSEELVTIGPHE